MMVYLINALILVALVWALRKVKISEALDQWFFPTLFLKIGAGIGVGLVYYYHYGYGDTIAYHEVAVRMTSLFSQDINSYLEVLFGQYTGNIEFGFSSQPRALFLVKLLSVVHLITANNYWLSSIYFSLFSFLGFWLLTDTLVRHFPKMKLEVIISLLLFPSVVFWSSGIIKESIAMGGLALLIKLIVDWYFGRKLGIKSIPLISLSLFLVWQLKYYYLGIFLIAAVPFILTTLYMRSDLRKVNLYVVYSISIIILALLVSWLHPNFHIDSILQVIVDNYELYRLDSRPDQLIDYSSLRPTIMSVVTNFPFAVWSGLFRMGIWESNQLVEHLVAVENMILLIFAIAAISKMAALKRSTHQIMIISTILYILLLSGFLAMSAPNLGTLARYKVGFTPLLILLILGNNPLFTYFKSKFNGNVEEVID